MQSLTRKAIMDSFVKLLNERPLHRITVKNIVEDCGVNRNSFYYHFEDLPSLAEAVLKEDADKILKNAESFESLSDCLSAAAAFALKNKKAALHLFNASNKELYLNYLSDISAYVVNKFIVRASEGLAVSETDKALITNHYKCLLMGYILDWLNSGMRYDIQENLQRVCYLFDGSVKSALLKSAEK